MDMSQFIATFFTESAEKLDELEHGLLDLDPRQPTDPDLINTIFRAAHTIKGGAGSFGFMAVSDFTHKMETLLDQVRNDEREVTPALVELLLEAKDGLGELLDAAHNDEPLDSEAIALIEQRLAAMLNGDLSLSIEQQPEPQPDASATGWLINFAPHPGMMHTGNDPLRIIKELSDLGDIAVTVDIKLLPAWDNFCPDDIYLSWQIELHGACSQDQIEDLFSWVEGECDLVINTMTADTAAAELPTPAPTPSNSLLIDDNLQAEVIVERRKETERRKKPGRRKSDKAEGVSIRVDINKIDNVINNVGELITTQSILSNLCQQFDLEDPLLLQSFGDRLESAVDQLERHTRDLQEHVMGMRMLPISFVFGRFGRTVHDLCSKLGKQVELHLVGENTELDKTVIEQIGDPLMHLIRNSMDHGFETPAQRAAAGKPETGVLLLNAYHKGGNVFIEICDDGRGLDRERLIAKALEKGLISAEIATTMSDQDAYQLIMQAGFSTATELSDVSGRGVGMDVVRQNIEALNGVVLIRSEQGVGTNITIRLPLTLAIMDGQLISVGKDTFVVPVVSIVESLQVSDAMVRRVAGNGELLHYRQEYLPILRLHRAFGLETDTLDLDRGVVVVLDLDGKRLAVFVDSIFGQQQVAVKSLESNFQRVQGVMGATILGDGSIALILDPTSLAQMNAISIH